MCYHTTLEEELLPLEEECLRELLRLLTGGLDEIPLEGHHPEPLYHAFQEAQLGGREHQLLRRPDRHPQVVEQT